jgi:hypothetical protein
LWLDKAQTSIYEEQCGLIQERTGLEEMSRRSPEISKSLDDMILRNTVRCGKLADLQEFLIACGAKAEVATKVLAGV